MKQPKLTKPELIAAVKRHATDRYGKGTTAWDVLIECWSDEEIGEEIGHVRTEKAAIAKCRKTLRLIGEQREDVRGLADVEDEADVIAAWKE